MPDPNLLVPHQIEEVQKLIDLIKEEDLVSFVVSEIGMGKTTLCKFLNEALPKQGDQDIVSIFLHGPSIENDEQMLRRILERLELRVEGGDKSAEFEQLRTWHENYPDFLLTIIIDEFPDIGKKTLNIVRSMVDLEKIVLVVNGRKGDLLDFVEENAPALFERKRHVLRLEPMELQEVRELIMYRMAWARGGDYEARTIDPFTEEAIQKIHDESEGIPRRVLKLAGDCVYNMVEKDKQKISPELVYERERKRDQKGSFWSFLPFVSD